MTTTAMKSPLASSSTTCSSSSSSSNNNNHHETPIIFGRVRRIPATSSRTTVSSSVVSQLRGGAVHEPETLEDVEALLVQAGSQSQLVVLDFSATWCGPCKMIAPLFAELSEQYTNVVFLKIDVDDNPDTAAKYNVSAMPTFVFVKQGQVVDRLMGASPQRLQELIDEHQ